MKEKKEGCMGTEKKQKERQGFESVSDSKSC